MSSKPLKKKTQKIKDVRIVCFSDSHRHRPSKFPKGDVLLYAGDDDIRNESQLKDFVRYLSSFPHSFKLWVAGNHDFFVEAKPKIVRAICEDYNVTYLENESCIVDGVRIWGSPITPYFNDWAFMKQRGKDIAKVWAKIPSDVDVVVTHGPAMGILDMTPNGEMVGDVSLLHVLKKLEPQYHVFGHIHGCYGETLIGKTTFVNASLCDENYDCVNKPIVIDVERGQ